MENSENSQNEPASNSGAGEQQSNDQELIETIVQSHKKKKQPSLVERAKKKMQEAVDENDEPQEKKSRSTPGYIRPQQREELATLVSSIFVMAIAASNVPDNIAPDSDEIAGVSDHLIKILARHVDLSKRLTGDVLDIIGIVAIASGWYARVSPALSEIRKQQETAKKQTRITDLELSRNVTTPIIGASPAVASFLDKANNSGAIE